MWQIKQLGMFMVLLGTVIYTLIISLVVENYNIQQPNPKDTRHHNFYCMQTGTP